MVKEGKVSGRVIVLLVIAVGLWAFVFFYYYGGNLFKGGKSKSTVTVKKVEKLDLAKERAFLKRPIVKLERKKGKLRGKYFEPIIVELKDVKDVLDIMVTGKEAPANFKYVGMIKIKDNVKVLISSGGVVREYGLNELVENVGVVYYANYLGVLLIDPDTGEFIVLK